MSYRKLSRGEVYIIPCEYKPEKYRLHVSRWHGGNVTFHAEVRDDKEEYMRDLRDDLKELSQEGLDNWSGTGIGWRQHFNSHRSWPISHRELLIFRDVIDDIIKNAGIEYDVLPPSVEKDEA